MYGILSFICLLISAILTAAYLLPIMIKGFFVGEKTFEKNEPNKLMTVPLVCLIAIVFLVGIFSGYIQDFILTML